MNYDPLATVPAPIVYSPTISEVYLYHEVPPSVGVRADANVVVSFKQWLTAHLPNGAVHTYGARDCLIIGLPMRSDAIVTPPGDFVVIDSLRSTVTNISRSALAEHAKTSAACAHVLLVHQHRRLVRMVQFTSALLTQQTARTKVQPLLDVLVDF